MRAVRKTHELFNLQVLYRILNKSSLKFDMDLGPLWYMNIYLFAFWLKIFIILNDLFMCMVA